VITEKTGSLIATSGRFGAMFAGAPDEISDLIAALKELWVPCPVGKGQYRRLDV